MDLTNEVYLSLDKYFVSLSHLGYKTDTDVDKLLVFSFIEELLYGPLSEYITEDDYRDIDRALYCLYGSCLIPFPEYKSSFTPTTNNTLKEYRVTETRDLRSTEDFNLRIKA